MRDDKVSKEQRRALRDERRKAALNKPRRRSGSVLAGFLLLVIGVILLLKEFGVPFPTWFFTWPMIVIAFGLLAGAGNSFRDPGWIIICGVGVVFLLSKVWTNTPIHHFIWPVLIIAAGFIFILAPRRRMWRTRFDEYDQEERKRWQQHGWQHHGWQQPQDVHTPAVTPTTTDTQDANAPLTDANQKPDSGKRSPDSWLDTVTIFSSVKKNVFSKNFKGGDIVSVFGGAEINLTQADFQGSIAIEVVQIFGGAKLIIPPHWQIRSEMVAIFGGIDDKRPPQLTYDEDKVVVLHGTTIFGGIEIKSY